MSSDETTTTGQHELIVGKFDPYSDEVAITRDGIVLAHVYGNDGGAVKALALDFVLGRERAQKAEAENARLRERVAALEGAGNAMAELVVRWMESATFSDPTDWYECRDCEAEGPAPEIIRHADGCAIGRWLAALAQAGEGGAA